MPSNRTKPATDLLRRRPPLRRAVVTGSAGFIGSHLVEALAAQGCDVVGIDNLDPWYDPSQKLDNALPVIDHPRFQHLELDLATAASETLRAVFAQADVVFHLAGRPGVQDSWGPGFAACAELNIVVSQRVFEAALQAGVGRVVTASSSSVYGDSATAGGSTVAPISPYGASKVAMEQLADVYQRRGLSVVALRYFTVFGPRQRPDMAFHRLFAACDGGLAFPKRGGGDQQREFTFVADVVEATVAAGTAPLSGTGTDTDTVTGTDTGAMRLDVGGGCVASLNDVIDAVTALIGEAPAIALQPGSPGDPRLTEADLGRTAHILGWSPTTSLDDGLAQQWLWHQRRRTATLA
jgi:nucleoside-diphosphate-sugar epimerase